MIFFMDRCSFSVRRRWYRLERSNNELEKVIRDLLPAHQFADTMLHGGYTSFRIQSTSDNIVVFFFSRPSTLNNPSLYWYTALGPFGHRMVMKYDSLGAPASFLHPRGANEGCTSILAPGKHCDSSASDVVMVSTRPF